MPSRDVRGTSRSHDAPSKPNQRFTSVSDLRRSLHSRNETSLIELLTTLRNQLSLKHEESVNSEDERLVFVNSWLEVSPGAQDIFDVWEKCSPRQLSLTSLIVAVLSSIITLLSSHYTYHALAHHIIKTVFTTQWMQKLNSYLSGSHTELILVTLKLYNSMSNYAGGKERRSLLEAFPWDAKFAQKLLHMRRKGKNSDKFDQLSRPDIRTLYILFILSFVDATTSSSVKITFLEQRRDTFSSIFKGFPLDSYSFIRHALEICWIGLWSDAKIRRTVKVGLFNENVLTQLVKLYERGMPEDDGADHIPADVVHHFLLAICTRPGTGVCFAEKGWYPRESDEDDPSPEDIRDDTKQKSKIYNKILANLIKLLKANEDPRQQELALKILHACPELVAGYWPSAGFALEPRLSSKWIANIAFFGSVVSLPVPTVCFLLDGESQLYKPVPPPLHTILDNIVPSTNIKLHLSRGLQSPSALVQHSTALALAKCLIKYEAIVQALATVESALEEEHEGQWAHRRAELAHEIRKRVPDFQVVVGFAQRLDTSAPLTGAQAVKTAMLSESAQRLMWLYYRSLPNLVAEARFDVGKLLLASQDSAAANAEATSAAIGLDILRQLHVLRLLRESDQFTWASKTGPHTYLYTLLKSYCNTRQSSVRSGIASLLRRVFEHDTLFQHDPDELILWLDALPMSQRSDDARAPDGTPLTDERECIVALLDGCAQRCHSTPYQYVEKLHKLSSEDVALGEDENELTADTVKHLPSPLIVTVLEQFEAGLNSLSPSDALATVTFIRKLLLRLACKLPTLVVPRRMEARVRRSSKTLTLTSSSVRSGVERELLLLQNGLALLHELPSSPSSSGANLEIPLTSTEDEMPESLEDRSSHAWQLVDRLRIQDGLVELSEIARLIASVERLDIESLQALFSYLDPISQSFWRCVDMERQYSVWRKWLRFDLLFLHCGHAELSRPACREVLTRSLLNGNVGHAEIKQALTLVNHRLSFLSEKEADSVLALMTSILQVTKSSIGVEEYRGLVQEYFTADISRSFFRTTVTGSTREALDNLLAVVLNANSDDDCLLVKDIVSTWAIVLKDDRADAGEEELATALLWARYLTTQDALALFDSTAENVESSSDKVYVIQNLLETIAPALSAFPKNALSRLGRLLRLQQSLPQNTTLERLLAAATMANLPLCIDGSCPLFSDMQENVMLYAVDTALERWSQRLVTDQTGVDVEAVLAAGELTDAATTIITSSIHKSRKAHKAIAGWLRAKQSDECAAPRFARILHVFADTAESQESEMTDDEPVHLTRHLKRLVTLITKRGQSSFALDHRQVAVAVLTSAVKRWRSFLPELQSSLRKACSAKTTDDSCRYFISLGRKLAMLPRDGVSDVLETIADMGLSWAVRVLSTGANLPQDDQATIAELCALTAAAPDLKSHLVEPVLTAAIQTRLSDLSALRLAEQLVRNAHLKPALVNKFLQNTVQHQELYTIASPSSPSPCRHALISLLYTLFHAHPTNTCQPTHVESLRPLYGGALSRADLQMLQIFQLFEVTRRASVAALLSTWSAAPDVASAGALDALLSLEPARVFRTCQAFPDRRALLDHGYGSGDDELDAQLYDPVFVILLVAQMMSEGVPESSLAWVQLFRTNVVCLLIRALSARDDALREIAVAQIGALYQKLQDADMQEKPHILHILNLLKDLLPKPPSDSSAAPTRLPAYTTLLLAHALRGVLHPAHFTYPLTSRFLLQRPALDAGDVPLLFSMLYASGDNGRRERVWIVHFLAEGMCGSAEWRVLKRRHTWELVASLFGGEERDLTLRRGILEFLASITCNAHAATALVLKGALLAWIEMQLQRRNVCGTEPLAWVRILENIVAVLDPGKAEAVTGGEWRAIISRCLARLLGEYGSTEGIHQAAIPLMLRLSLLPDGPTRHMHDLLALYTPWLRTLEFTLSFPESGLPPTLSSALPRSSAPYTAHAVFRAPMAMDVRTWGTSIEALWRVSMALEEKGAAWDELSARLLVWRGIVGEESIVGEWARREVVKSMVRT